MCKRLFGFLIVAFFLLSGHAWAAPPCTASQPVYISSGTQILCVETASGANSGKVTVLLTDSTSVFQDIAFGPDGLLYFTDSLRARVFRLDPKISIATAATLVASLPSGTTPTGLSFSSSNGTGDLYVNSSIGVFKIPGVAVTPDAGLSSITPVQVIIFTPGITAGGNAFDVFAEVENLVIVDQTNKQILQSAPPFSSATSLTSVPSPGPGIFANFCGDLLVANGTTIQRLSLTFSRDKNDNLVTTASPSFFVDLGTAVRYLEVTADSTVLAATFSNGAGGTVWRVDPVKDPATGVPSCSDIASTTKLVSLKSALQAKTPPDLASNIANGVALPPTSISITQQFGTGTNVVGLYNFGLYKLSVTYKQVLRSFLQTFTAVRSRPADISFSPGAFPNNTVPIHFSPFGGFAIQFATPTNGAPAAGTDYAASTPGTHDAIQLKISYSTEDFLLNPGAGHAPGDTLLTTSPTLPITYTEDVTHDFWFADQTNGGATDGWSAYVAFNEALMQTATLNLKSPVSSCGVTTTPTCNPQFKIGQNVAFGFTLTPVPPATTLSLATSRLSIAKVLLNAADGTVQIDQTIDVFSTNNRDVDNFFKVGSSLNNYTYNWDSSGATAAGPGLYLATIFSDSSAPPLKVFLTLKQ